MRRPKIIADNKIPFLVGVLEPYADVEYYPGKEITSDVVKDADAIITRTRTKCDKRLLEGSKVKFIASATIGFDHIDTAYCEMAGIKWTNAPGCNASSVQQYIVSALLYLGHLKDLDLTKLTLGVIGVGNVGRKVCRAAAALGLNVIMNDPPRERAEGGQEFRELDVLLRESDIVTLHVPLNRSGMDRTLHMVDPSFVMKMRKGSVLINTSRGEVCDGKAVKQGLKQERFGAVVLDVFENEPAIDLELLDLLTLATPHIAGYSTDGKANGTMMSVRAVSRFFKLGIDTWEPFNLPGPAQRDLYLDASGTDMQEMIRDVFNQTYDINSDNLAFRDNPQNFELLREKYPVRREPHAYSVRVFNGDSEMFRRLEGLGFSAIGDSCF